jgi:hypothetical protein
VWCEYCPFLCVVCWVPFVAKLVIVRFCVMIFEYRFASQQFAADQYSVYLQHYSEIAGGAQAGGVVKFGISDSLLGLAQLLDRVAIMGCVMFSEIPAHNKV